MLCTFAAEKKEYMKQEYLFTIPDYVEDPYQSLLESRVISIQLKVERMEFASTFSSLSLFEGIFSFRSYTQMPHFDVAHDSTWDDFGRAYYDSRDFQIPEFHCTLYSVDELQRQIEAKMLQFEENCSTSEPCIMEEERHCNLMDRYFAENHWNEELYAWVEDFKAKTLYSRNLLEADDHSCRPFDNTSIYLHQLAKLSLSVQNAPTSAASRPCCRSFLMATCRQLSGDDILGH